VDNWVERDTSADIHVRLTGPVSRVKKRHGAETDHGRQRRETADKPQVNGARYVTRRETPGGPESTCLRTPTR
jgi:hypothetical protein